MYTTYGLNWNQGMDIHPSHSVLAFAGSLIPLSVDWFPLLLILHIGKHGHGQIPGLCFLHLGGCHTEVESFDSPEKWNIGSYWDRCALLDRCVQAGMVWESSHVYKNGCQEPCCSGHVDGSGIRVQIGHSQSWVNRFELGGLQYPFPATHKQTPFFFSPHAFKNPHLRLPNCIM